ncbi:hypothetical protein QJS10_CPA02g01070 [Acorus calamus]|uniref:Reverse transcriptase n=1 Tax=Acorus calamus TaxID=4465 RepID=A0AAV9FDN4_ACOCL|nr:hypothetical protein QJS10_CPA02g01070 [Acorus calamus]
MGNSAWFSLYAEAYVQHLPESLSDHTALKLFAAPPLQSYPKPFKFFNVWLQHDSFMPTLCAAWELDIDGSAMFKLAKKLQHTKRILKAWNIEHFGIVLDKLKEGKELLNSVQAALLLDTLNPHLIASESSAREKYVHVLHFEEEVIRQKAQVKWLQNGDRCTKFFYAQFAARKAHNTLRSVILPDGLNWWSSDRCSSTRLTTSDLFLIKRLLHLFPQFIQKLGSQSRSVNLFAPQSLKRKSFLTFNR